jgi:peptidoglycan/xylan/chitin deacetylase (PgdA/CDA1 family)
VDNPIYDFRPIVDRPVLRMPDGAQIAVWLGINIEHYAFGVPALSLWPAVEHLVPDPINYGWRDYGNRVGIWRLFDRLAELGIRGTMLMNSEVCERYPRIIEAAAAAGWPIAAHGRENSTLQAQLSADEEVAYIEDVTATIERHAGARPVGWLGPFRSSSMQTHELLAQAGYTHLLDWNNDDQPYLFNTTAGRLCSVPYSVEVSDIAAFVRHSWTGPEFERVIRDAFDTLYEEGAQSARVLGLSLHPFLIGQSFRIGYLIDALRYMSSFDGVW